MTTQNEIEMAACVREIERLVAEKKEANRDWNERIKEQRQILKELAENTGR